VIDDKEAIQTVPFNRNAWHSGDGHGQGNRASIGIEICYSLDNGYSGAQSARYKAAEENAALYTAYVLNQYGWGTDRLRQHWHWSRKDCPHKMRAHNGWGKFVARVQAHLNAIKGGKKAPTKPVTTPTKPKVTPSTTGKYTVKKGDTLWGIAKANNTTVAKIKSLSGLKSDTIKVGQKLTVSGGSTASTVNNTTPKPKKGRYETGWSYPGTFTANSTIVVRRGGPGLRSAAVGPASYIYKGQFVNFDHLFYKNGYWWIRFKYPNGANNNFFFMPVGKRNPNISFVDANKRNHLWGKVTKLNMNESKSGVKNWSKKNAVK